VMYLTPTYPRPDTITAMQQLVMRVPPNKVTSRGPQGRLWYALCI
jgi:hypothetical protein